MPRYEDIKIRRYKDTKISGTPAGSEGRNQFSRNTPHRAEDTRYKISGINSDTSTKLLILTVKFNHWLTSCKS